MKLLLISNRWTQTHDNLVMDKRTANMTKDHQRKGMMLQVRGWVSKAVRVMLYGAAPKVSRSVWP